MVHDLAAHRAKEQGAEPAATAAADDDQVGFLGCVDERLGGEPAERDDGDELGLHVTERGGGLVDVLLRGLPDLIDPLVVAW